MKEVKDTVMPLEYSVLDRLHRAGISDSKILKALKAQAEISFKAGIQEVTSWIRNHTDCIAMGQDMEEAAGNENSYGIYSHMYVRWLDWQAQLKEWEVETKD